MKGPRALTPTVIVAATSDSRAHFAPPSFASTARCAVVVVGRQDDLDARRDRRQLHDGPERDGSDPTDPPPLGRSSSSSSLLVDSNRRSDTTTIIDDEA